MRLAGGGFIEDLGDDVLDTEADVGVSSPFVASLRAIVRAKASSMRSRRSDMFFSELGFSLEQCQLISKTMGCM